MSTVVERIGRYAADLRFDELDAPVVDYAKRILLDSLACAYGGLDSDPARIVRATAQEELNGGEQATVFGKAMRLSAPLAALANGVALRYQDYNDVYFGPAWTAHPSDNIATLLAAAEWCDRSGREFLRAMVIAYCVAVALVAGEVTPRQFSDEWLRDSAVAALMAKTRLEEKPELTALFRQGLRPAAVEVKTPRGAFHREVLRPLGDPRNPMKWDDVVKKFIAQAEPVLGSKLTREIVDRTFSIEKEENMRAFAEMLGGKRT